MGKTRLGLWLIILLTAVSMIASLPSVNLPSLKLYGKEISLGGVGNLFPLKLGLDLQGGTELLLEADMSKVAPRDRDSALESARQVIERRVNLYGVSESVVQSSKLGEQRRIIVELPGVKDLQSAVSLVGKTAQLEFKEVSASSSAVSTGLTGADLKKASVVFGSSRFSNSGPQVQIEFTPAGADKFAQITRRNIGKPVGIFLDESLVSAPVVQQEIVGGSAVISGNFTAVEAKNLSIQLNAGALPVPIKILSQRNIAATLGQTSLQKSMIAASIGLLTVIVYMVLFYGLYGLLADVALIIYALVTLMVFKTGLFIIPPVTLTLAGIAGFILSIGMAVDANILTFERMKEELRAGKTGRLALEHGFERAWTSIRDSNVSSLITAGVLFFYGTSVVRGFALTLAIGVLVSMFSAVVVTRTFLRLLPRFSR